MALLDYGAIVFKNGKLITKNLFTEMKDAVGWEDTEEDVLEGSGSPIRLRGNYYSYIGDRDRIIGFYKTSARFLWRTSEEGRKYVSTTEWFSDTHYEGWIRWRKLLGREYAVVTKRNGYFVLRWKYKGDRYKVYFGSGVDVDSYKKWRIVNYYRSIPHYIGKIICKIKYGF